LWAKAITPRIRLVGVQPEASPPFAAQRVTGSTRPIPIGPTLADGVAGNVERAAITWKLSQRLVDEIVLVNEAEIARAMGWAWQTHRHRLEGSGALSIAAISGEHLGDLSGRRVAAVLSGGNVDDDTFRAATAIAG
jgi:threonine dehydratase